jgi:cyclopropane fatty-acyl-phospholipid synthase-like methyltransferase
MRLHAGSRTFRRITRVMADQFETAYLEGSPPWDIGRAQPDLVKLAEAGRITGRVIDVGCGTGENALYLARLGLDVVGVDGAPEAIRQARVKANTRGISTKFDVADVLDLGDYRESFDTATDSGVFHVFDDRDRSRYQRSVHGALRPGAHLFLLCFSERQPGDWGPRRVTQRELRETFSDGWHVDSIDEAHLDTNLDDAPQVEAWLAALTRL